MFQSEIEGRRSGFRAAFNSRAIPSVKYASHRAKYSKPNENDPRAEWMFVGVRPLLFVIVVVEQRMERVHGER